MIFDKILSEYLKCYRDYLKDKIVLRYYVSYSGLNSLLAISEQYQQQGEEDKDEIKQLLSYSSNLYPNNDNNSSYYSKFFNLIEINLFSNPHRLLKFIIPTIFYQI